jgi:serine/threonine protein kinase
LKDIENEATAIEAVMSEGGHQNIVTVLKHGWLDGSVYFIDMELCDYSLEGYIQQERRRVATRETLDGNDFLDSKERVSEMWSIMSQITSGLVYIHSKSQVHRDLKPSNGIIPNILDFLISKYFIPSRPMPGK